MIKKIGFLVNPIAGMGGSVGLKGTDGNLYYEALKRGAKPVAPQRALRFIKSLKSVVEKNKDILLIVAPNVMGFDYVKYTDINYKVLNTSIKIPTTAEDTKKCTYEFLREGVNVITFVGGDGTAKDIFDVVKGRIPILGIPSGVKMYSGVFATTPEIAVKILLAFLKNQAQIIESEIADVDEEFINKGILKVKIYGYVRTLQYQDLVSPTKDFISGDEENKEEIAIFVKELMEDDVLYLLGPGSTIASLAKILKIPKTLLGVDAVYNGKLIAKDLTENDILKLINKFDKVKIIVTPIGKQGFILGRGNQQFSPRVLKKVGINNIIVIATRNKLNQIKYIRVDTGDPTLDSMFPEYVKVITGFNEYTVVRVLKGDII